MQISKPTVALPSSRCSKLRVVALRSIIAIIPGVDRTFTGSVPPHVGEQAALGRELLGALDPRLERHVAGAGSRTDIAQAKAITPRTASASGAPTLTVVRSSNPGSWMIR